MTSQRLGLGLHILLLLVASSLSPIIFAAGELFGTIESCSGCALNRLPQLKAFLKEPNGVDQYKNVEVNFITGKKAILTIFKDGKEVEKVTLSDYDDKARLHQLFVQKGFEQYSREEMVARRKMKEAEDAAVGAHIRGSSGVQRMLNQNKKSGADLSPKLRKQQMKEKLRQLKEARENYMVVGAPRG